jgi:pimeloyl-ACP methyl ester carboxylesterase
VSVNRRGYGESTPFSSAELAVLTSGTDEERQDFVAKRGRELLSFVDTFIQANNIPSVEEDYTGRQGGVILLGWSLGAYVVLSALTQLETLSTDKLARLRSHLSSVIIHGGCALSLFPYLMTYIMYCGWIRLT